MDINKRAPFTLLVFCVVFTIGNGVKTTSEKLSQNEAIAYLERYNYLNKTVVKAALHTGKMSASILEAAVSQFQEMVNIPLTGMLDNETLHKMALPRCGVVDVPDDGPENTYAPLIWPKKFLIYTITDYSTTSNLTIVEQRLAMSWAFGIWMGITPLKFGYSIRPEDPADIFIKFATGYHGDNKRFDGPGNVLAHAYYPTDGSIHFDDDETWLMGKNAENEGTDLYKVAAHEVGHALGLRHSNIPGSIMVPIYSYSSYVELSWEDENALKSLYGEPSSKRKSDRWFQRK